MRSGGRGGPYASVVRQGRATIVSTIPSGDRAFRRAVEVATDDEPAPSPEDLAARLRPLYPRIAVFERALSGEEPGFYAYRDGSYHQDAVETWWARPETLHARISVRTGQITALNSDGELTGCPREELLDREFTEFVAPSARVIARALFELAIRGEVRSRALVLRPDGGTVLVDFRAIRNGTEIEVAYRLAEPG
jgi:hypothetical protein